MKTIKYDYGLLINIHCAIGSLQTSSILCKDDSSKFLVDSVISDIKSNIKYYNKKRKECPLIRDIDVPRVKQLFKSYRKMIKNSLKHNMP